MSVVLPVQPVRSSHEVAWRVLSQRSGRRTLPALGLLLLAAWALHWRAFGLAELGADGPLSIDLARIPVPDMLAFTGRDLHPPLFYLLLHGWFNLAGASYLTAKFLPIAAGMLALATLYGLGRRLSGPVTGLASVGLFAIAPADAVLGSTVRDYLPGLACSLLTLLLTLRLVAPGASANPRRAGVLLALCTTAALLTWYFHPLFLATEAALLLGARGAPSSLALHWRPSLSVAARALVAGVAIALPWYAYTLPRLLPLLAGGATAFDAAATLPAPAAVSHALAMAIAGRSADVLGVLAVGGWLAALVIGMAGRSGPGSAPPTRWHVGVLGVGLGLGAAVALGSALRWAQADALQRYVLVALPFAVLLQALALTWARLPWRLLAGAALVPTLLAQTLSYFGLATGAPIPYTDDRAFAYLASHTRPGDVLLFTDPQRRARYRLSGGSMPTAVVVGSEPHYLLDTPQRASATVTALAARYRRIWYVESSLRAAAATLARAPLATRAYEVEQRNFGAAAPALQQYMATTLRLYLTSPPATMRRLNAIFGGRITLESAAFTSRVASGEALAVDLQWSAIRAPGAAYTVFVHLDDARGHLVAQHDGPPADGLRPTDAWRPGEIVDDRRGVALPADLPPGDYRLSVGLYRGDQRLALADGGASVTLGVVHIS